MNSNAVDTEEKLSDVVLAPSKRASRSELERQIAYFSDLRALGEVLSVVPNPVIILNAYRQIVYANKALADLVEVDEVRDLYGQRPGEALACLHVSEDAACGTTAFCMLCGAARAIAEAQQGVVSVQDCRIVREPNKTPSAFDLRVWTKPYVALGETFTIFAAVDVSDQKRRQALERIFFHDVLNTVQKMRTAVDLLEDVEPAQMQELFRILQRSIERLTKEIEAQRDLVAMENEELTLNPMVLSTEALLDGLVDSYVHERLGRRHELKIADASEDVVFVADRTKLRRVLDNMIKNALEAEPPGATITIGAKHLVGESPEEAFDGAFVEFWVHNPSAMPSSVQRQVYQRSFSTKGSGRGLGTYSMRVLTERYLEGEIGFTSSEEEGTTFRARYPVAPTYAEEQPSRPGSRS